MKKIFLTIIVLFFSLSGCSTYQTRVGDPKYGYLFPATRTDVKVLASDMNTGIFAGDSFIIKTLFVLDIPVSLVTDIVIMPYDIILIATDKDNKEGLHERNKNEQKNITNP